MICFDTQVLIWGVQGYATPGQEQMIERIKRYIEHLERQHEAVAIPAPALFEYLLGFEPKDLPTQSQVVERGFMVLPLDIPSVHVAAELLGNTAAMQQLKVDYQGRRQKLRVDAMIVAIAIAHKADKIVSGDQTHFQRFAQGRIEVIEVIEVPDIPRQSDLFQPTPNGA